MTTTDVTELQALCREWQERLNLTNWTINVEIKRYHEMPDEWGGSCDYKPVNLDAWIYLLHPGDTEGMELMRPFDMEKMLVHELLHIHFSAFFEKEPGLIHVAQEQTIEQIARALVRLKRQIGVAQTGAGYDSSYTGIAS
jgi:hypothetical protein